MIKPRRGTILAVAKGYEENLQKCSRCFTGPWVIYSEKTWALCVNCIKTNEKFHNCCFCLKTIDDFKNCNSGWMCDMCYLTWKAYNG